MIRYFARTFGIDKIVITSMGKRKSTSNQTKAATVKKAKTEEKKEKSDKNEEADKDATTSSTFTQADWSGPTSKSYSQKLTSWNINGIRSWVKSGSQSFLTKEKPDVLGVQETKCNKDKIPDEVKVSGYTNFFSSGDKEGYAGTGLFSKVKPISITEGIGKKEHDEEGRVITAEYDKFYFITAYVPNSGRGLPRLPYRQNKWDPDFADYIKKLDAKKPVVICGDLNVSHEPIDLANPKGNKRNAGFTQEERDGFSALLDKCDLVDTFRHFYPGATGAYSFWTYMGNARAKNVGWRLDYFLVSKRFLANVVDSRIDIKVMGSDHCPISLYLKF